MADMLPEPTTTITPEPHDTMTSDTRMNMSHDTTTTELRAFIEQAERDPALAQAFIAAFERRDKPPAHPAHRPSVDSTADLGALVKAVTDAMAEAKAAVSER